MNRSDRWSADTVVVPATAGVSWIAAALDVASIGSDIKTRTRVLTGTPVAPLAGAIETSVGGTVSSMPLVMK